jgi:hypothetical protein
LEPSPAPTTPNDDEEPVATTPFDLIEPERPASTPAAAAIVPTMPEPALG